LALNVISSKHLAAQVGIEHCPLEKLTKTPLGWWSNENLTHIKIQME